MSRLGTIRTLPALGLGNVARVGLYRLGLRSGFHPVQRVAAAIPRGPFFAQPTARAGLPQPNASWQGKLRWYDWKEVLHEGGAPDWFAHPFGGRVQADVSLPWWRIPDFGGGDVKNLWELSRFGWAPAMATLAATGDRAAYERLEGWLASWTEANPPYRGANWKCGQEASIRVIHLLATAIVLDQDRAPLPGLIELVRVHLQRIAPTVSYAIGQQNNHATSEATALFAGGDFLHRAGLSAGARWARVGRRLLENRATCLIEPDGSFSQYSLNYHRLMLDAYAFAEVWRRRNAMPPLSARAQERLRAATDWLDAMIEREGGDGPNLGANDGARLIPLTDTGYRDFRPSLQLASAAFRGVRAIEAHGVWDDPLRWLGLEVPEGSAPAPGSRTFDDGGYHVLRRSGAIAVLRYPRFRFRPSQADALHLDLWVGTRNLLRDGGTFSYNDEGGTGAYLASTAAHNTVEFDGRAQMPRLGRFLFSDWLKASGVEPVETIDERVIAAAGYADRQGALHHRKVSLGDDELVCTDQVGGRFAAAVLRWRLAPGKYALEGARLVGDAMEIAIDVNGASADLSLVQAPESRCYQHEQPIPVLEVKLDRPATVTTTVRFGDRQARS